MLLRDPQFIMRLDGRCNKHVIFEAVVTRLLILGIPPAYAVSRFFPLEGEGTKEEKVNEVLGCIIT